MREIQKHFAPLPGGLCFEADPLELFAQLRLRLVYDGVTFPHLDDLKKPHTNAKRVQHHQHPILTGGRVFLVFRS